MSPATVPPAEPAGAAELARHYLPELVYGANDGIITTFAVLTGVAGAALPARTALILGIANLLADGFSMGASAFLSLRSREAVRATREEAPLEPFPLRHAFATWAAFVVAGSIPLLLYALAPPAMPLGVAVGGTLLALFAVGALRSAITGLRWWVAGAEMLAVGAAAAAVSFGVGALAARVI